MQDIDRMIDEALDSEERELLGRLDEESFFAQAFGVFGGRTGWVNGVMMAVQTILFVAAVWTGWHFFAAGDTVTQLRWGLPAAVMVILSTMIKLALVPRMEGNRLMRELKRIELQIVRNARG
ncbi:MAG: DUF6768 family protein [Sphingomicrobium sp.]